MVYKLLLQSIEYTSENPSAMRYILFLFLPGVLMVSLSSCANPETPAEDAYYQEPHRPQFHFSPEANWMNDPNGMVYYEGEYHLFYQYYPDSNVWGPMHWGHAVSTDLVHWEHLPIALYPDSLGYIFSGSAVVDWNNTSGFGEEGNPPLVAIYTYHDPAGAAEGRNDFQTQGIAYSLDKGRTWIKYAGNPVLENPGLVDFRDPKVIWDEDSGQWVMVLAAFDHVKLYGSADLKAWDYLSDFGREWGTHGGVWECPDLFPMQVEGTAEKKWVLIQNLNPGGPNGGSGVQYFVGDFDGTHFRVDTDFAGFLGNEPAFVPDGAVFADFEGQTYGDWEVSGTAFGPAPAKGALSGQNPVSGFMGKQLVNSFFQGDGTTGTLTSPSFIIEKAFINFLIGGGNHPGETGVELIVGEEVVRSATGRNTEALDWVNWDVSDLRGKEARIRIVDQHTGGWGHINADHFLFSDQEAHGIREKAVWLDHGRDNYAGVTWSDVPASDGRRIFLGWMSNWAYAQDVPTTVWRSAMTLPRSLHLAKWEDTCRLASKPVIELETLRKETIDLQEKLQPGAVWEGISPRLLEVELTLEMTDPAKTDLGLELSNGKGEVYRIGFNGGQNAFYSDRSKAGPNDFSEAFTNIIPFAPRLITGNTLKLHLFFDVASAELFADDGLTSMTEIFFPSENFSTIRFYSNQPVTAIQARCYPLQSIW
jgi:beta-fructofuranosidase/levanase/fructan beta-fructosidase